MQFVVMLIIILRAFHGTGLRLDLSSHRLLIFSFLVFIFLFCGYV